MNDLQSGTNNPSRVNPFFSVIIVNYNAGAMLTRVMSALSGQTYRHFEVIVIDNNSQDHSWCATENLPFPCRLVRLQENTGFAAANNLAVREHAQGDWLFLLNPDAFPEPDCLETVARGINFFPTINCFGCALISARQPDRLDGLGDAYHVSGLHWRQGHGDSYRTTPTDPKEIFSACAAAAVYRTTVFRQLGGFDETYFAYSEDVDLGFRLRLAGGQTLLLPQARVHHVGSGITGRSSDFSIYHGHRNLTWTFIKNVPGPLLPLLLPLHLAMIFCLAIVFAATGRFWPYFRAKTDAFSRIGHAWGQRKTIQNTRVCSCMDLLRLMSWLPRSIQVRAPVRYENTTPQEKL